jgi:hypothetical protein
MDFENIMMQLFPMFPMFPTFTIFASETMGPIYFETFQSLQITNIVFLTWMCDKIEESVQQNIMTVVIMTTITIIMTM